MDALHQSAQRISNLVHKNNTANYVQLTDLSDQEFLQSELQREGMVPTPPPQMQAPTPRSIIKPAAAPPAPTPRSIIKPAAAPPAPPPPPSFPPRPVSSISNNIVKPVPAVGSSGAMSGTNSSSSPAMYNTQFGAAGSSNSPAMANMAGMMMVTPQQIQQMQMQRMNMTPQDELMQLQAREDQNMVDLQPAPGGLPPSSHFGGFSSGGLGYNNNSNQSASVQTMVEGAVKLVSMLNFMKVELGDRKTLRSKEQWRAAGAEFIGTLLFVYLGCGSVVAAGMVDETGSSKVVAIAIAHGLAIVFLCGATGAISGGHLNPAVTLAFVVAGKETLLRAGLYVAAQLLGGIIGAALLKDSTPAMWIGALGSHDLSHGVSPGQAFLMEIMLTFALIFVIFGVAVDRRGPGVIAPLPIGFVVLVDHLVGVPYTGASMNPARSFGPAIVSGNWSPQFWVYWFGPCFGATMASALYRHVFLEPVPVAVLPTSTPNNNTRK